MNEPVMIRRRFDLAEPQLKDHSEDKGADIRDEERVARFVASDESVDRYGDVVMQDGWDLKAFRRNPVFLWMHNQDKPIGTVRPIEVVDGKLMATVKFYDAGDSALSDYLWRLVKKRKLNAVSVGFNVKGADDYEAIRDENDRTTGYRFLNQELLELSLVAVPANPNALQVARSCGLPDDLIREALPMDASVRDEQLKWRQRLLAVRMRGVRAAAPR
jgi:HK97 family phage prohead protease